MDRRSVIGSLLAFPFFPRVLKAQAYPYVYVAEGWACSHSPTCHHHISAIANTLPELMDGLEKDLRDLFNADGEKWHLHVDALVAPNVGQDATWKKLNKIPLQSEAMAKLEKCNFWLVDNRESSVFKTPFSIHIRYTTEDNAYGYCKR